MLQTAQLAMSLLTGLLVLAALALLYMKSRSPWLVGALLCECLSVGFRLALEFMPNLFRGDGIVPYLWPCAGLLLGACLLGYAIGEAASPPPGPQRPAVS